MITITFDEVNAFVEEIAYLPHNVFPGHIGGHCVMPNIEILRRKFASKFLEAVVESNESKGKKSLVTAGQKAGR